MVESRGCDSCEETDTHIHKSKPEKRERWDEGDRDRDQVTYTHKVEAGRALVWGFSRVLVRVSMADAAKSRKKKRLSNLSTRGTRDFVLDKTFWMKW